MRVKKYLACMLMAALLTGCGAAEEAPSPVESTQPPAASIQETEEKDPLADLYLQVLEDLWAVDGALNADISMVGVDLSGTSLTEEDQTALAEAFAESHGVALVQGTWQELCDQGYIDVENLYWADGCHFSIIERELEGTYSLPTVGFDAQKWRSGLGAYFFCDCTAVQSQAGEWGYSVGAEAIS